MTVLRMLGLICLAATCQGMCFEKYSGRHVPEGGTIMRSKTMGKTTLIGTYNCTCLSRGRLHCFAFDLPCYDVTRATYAAKGSRFHARPRGVLSECTCMGGPMRFQDCRSTISLGGTVGCHDIIWSRYVRSGQLYYTENFGVTLKCRCDNGRPARNSCERSTNVEIDPCKTARCHYSAQCTAKGRSYSCECNRGFTGDGVSCHDIDECTSGSASCDLNAICINSIGSYTCTCKPGFLGDGLRCTDEAPDPCTAGIWFCDVRAQCIPNGNDYTCRCTEGYTGSGLTCTDLNECTSGDARCDQNAYCNNTEGSYRCTCNNGYEGSGYYCSKMCRDEAVGNYVRTGDVFTTISMQGIEMTCSCQNGEPVEGSCISSREDVVSGKDVEVDAPCNDALSMRPVASGEYFVSTLGGTSLRCLCDNGRPLRGSCRPSFSLRTITIPTTAIPTTTTTTTAKAKKPRPTSRPPGCFDRQQNVYHSPGDTYIWKRGSTSYSCTCTSERGTSRCKKIRRTAPLERDA